MLNQYFANRQRRTFGRQCLFSDRNKLQMSIIPKHQLARNYILKNPVHTSTQLSDQLALDELNTDSVPMKHSGMFHYEGGWPKDVNILDEEQTTRHRKKVERDEIWGQKVILLTKPAVHAIHQNSAVNIYQEYFEDMDCPDMKNTFEARLANVFHDPLYNEGRMVGGLDWSPSPEPHVLTVLWNTVIPPFLPLHDHRFNFYIWNTDNPLKPLLTFKAPYSVHRALFCPKDSEIVAGCMRSGMVALWDARVGGEPVSVCPLEAAHTDVASSICWVHSKTNMEFYSGSIDGTVKYWDGRNMNNFVQNVQLDTTKTDEPDPKRTLGATVLEFEYTIPVKYNIATEHGIFFVGNRKGFTPIEILSTSYRMMVGPIKVIVRNPFFVKNILIIGDWGAQVWSEECKDFPIIRYENGWKQYNTGCWSTQRCSLFFTGGKDGRLEFWDFLLDLKKPIYFLDTLYPIISLSNSPNGKFVACGLSNGDFKLYEVDEAFQRCTSKEKMLTAALFERELQRLKNLDGRLREIILKEKALEKARLEAEKAKKKRGFGEEEEEEEEEEIVEGEGEEFEGGEEDYVDPDPVLTASKKYFYDLCEQVRIKRSQKEYEFEKSIIETYVPPPKPKDDKKDGSKEGGKEGDKAGGKEGDKAGSKEGDKAGSKEGAKDTPSKVGADKDDEEDEPKKVAAKEDDEEDEE